VAGVAMWDMIVLVDVGLMWRISPLVSERRASRTAVTMEVSMPCHCHVLSDEKVIFPLYYGPCIPLPTVVGIKTKVLT